MSTYYDDNFGHYDMSDDPAETIEFYRHVQRSSVEKVCSICGRTVKIMPQYDKCNSCCERIESGMDF
jgi:hypothetical protein